MLPWKRRSTRWKNPALYSLASIRGHIGGEAGSAAWPPRLRYMTGKVSIKAYPVLGKGRWLVTRDHDPNWVYFDPQPRWAQTWPQAVKIAEERIKGEW